jgi:hypothetical protein
MIFDLSSFGYLPGYLPWASSRNTHDHGRRLVEAFQDMHADRLTSGSSAIDFEAADEDSRRRTSRRDRGLEERHTVRRTEPEATGAVAVSAADQALDAIHARVASDVTCIRIQPIAMPRGGRSRVDPGGHR